jgi:hypothetical protein
MTIGIAFLGALGVSLLLAAAFFPFERAASWTPASSNPLDRADAVTGDAAPKKEITILDDKPILDRILSPWILAVTRRAGPDRKEDIEDRLRRAGYPYKTAADYYGAKLINGFTGFLVGLIIVVLLRSPALIFIPIGLAALGVFSPDQAIGDALKNRKEMLFAEMAFTLDRLATLCESGIALLEAMKELCARPGGLFITEMRISLNKVDLVGKSPREAMKDMLARLPEMDEAHTFVEKVLLGVEQARPVGSALRAMGHRMQRKVEADMLARGMRKLLLITGIGIATLIPAAMLIMATMPLVQAMQMLSGG